MKSGKNGLIGPGSNNYGRDEKHIVDVASDISPELADKILRAFRKKAYDDKVTKERVLHHLKQLKAQMSKLKTKEPKLLGVDTAHNQAIDKCMAAIDKKIEKVTKE